MVGVVAVAEIPLVHWSVRLWRSLHQEATVLDTDLDVDIVLPNKEEGQVLTGCDDPHDIARDVAKIFPSALVVLKLDADGALVLDGDSVTHIPPATNKLVDATGAGDSFAGAFLAHHLVHRSPVAAARFATRVSAWVIEHIGARPLPDSRLASLTSPTN